MYYQRCSAVRVIILAVDGKLAPLGFDEELLVSRRGYARKIEPALVIGAGGETQGRHLDPAIGERHVSGPKKQPVKTDDWRRLNPQFAHQFCLRLGPLLP